MELSFIISLILLDIDFLGSFFEECGILAIWSKQGRERSTSYNRILWRYQFSCVIALLDLTCMVLHVVLCYYDMGFSRCDSDFSLAFAFIDIHGVMGF